MSVRLINRYFNTTDLIGCVTLLLQLKDKNLMVNFIKLSDCIAIKGDQERKNPGDAHVPSELRDVPYPRFLHKRVYPKTAETRLQVFGMGVFRLQRIRLHRRQMDDFIQTIKGGSCVFIGN